MAQRQWRSDDTDTWLEGFGDGSDGSTYSAPANAGCSGTSGTTSLTLDSASSFSDGDLVIIHQSRGSSTAAWELNKISSGGGTTSLTLAYDLTNTYTDSGASQAQIIEMKQYDGLTTGSQSASSWNGSQGGIIGWFDKGTCTINGTLSVNARGFRGGQGSGNSNVLGKQGGGYPNENFSNSASANGNGGGGGQTGANNGGAGGGNGTAGQSYGGGSGGASVGTASLINAHFGGGGGGSSADSGTPTGGSGGGIAFIFANDLTITGSIDLSGGNGGYASIPNVSSGGGAGGSCLLKCVTATLGSNLITASGGTQTNGGTGGVGRIHIDYSDSFTGTTSPAIDSTLDTTITAGATGNFFMFF